MKNLLKYREPSYFKEGEKYLLEGSWRIYVSMIQNHKGQWFAVKPPYFGKNRNVMEYKMTSVPCVNVKELIGLPVRFSDSLVVGTISKFLCKTDVGIYWKGGENIKKYGLPYYWNDIRNIELI